MDPLKLAVRDWLKARTELHVARSAASRGPSWPGPEIDRLKDVEKNAFAEVIRLAEAD